jgi:hypothetical protein
VTGRSLVKDYNLYRWIPRGIVTYLTNIERLKFIQEFLVVLVDSWWIPGGIVTCLKKVKDPNLPRNSW